MFWKNKEEKIHGTKILQMCHCGKIIAVVKETGVPVMCCGQKMDELVPNTTDAAQEKHVPLWK